MEKNIESPSKRRPNNYFNNRVSEEGRQELRASYYRYIKDALDRLKLGYLVITPMDKYLLKETPEDISLFSLWGEEYYYDKGVSKRKAI